MFVIRDIDEILSRQYDVLERYPKRDCDNCKEAKNVRLCQECIKRHLDDRQTLEDIRRM